MKRYGRGEPVKTLWCDSIEAQSIEVDWMQTAGENGDGWISYEAVECEKCGAVLVLNTNGGNEPHHYLDDTKCDGHVPLTEGPMMDYYYPIELRQDPIEAARLIQHLPLCLIEWGDGSGRDGYALALTGGGMDLSWEICEAFMRLGWLPPARFARDLPGMAGRGTSPRDQWIMAGCRRSCRVQAGWCRRGVERIDQLARQARERQAARKPEPQQPGEGG